MTQAGTGLGQPAHADGEVVWLSDREIPVFAAALIQVSALHFIRRVLELLRAEPALLPDPEGRESKQSGRGKRRPGF